MMVFPKSSLKGQEGFNLLNNFCVGFMTDHFAEIFTVASGMLDSGFLIGFLELPKYKQEKTLDKLMITAVTTDLFYRKCLKNGCITEKNGVIFSKHLIRFA